MRPAAPFVAALMLLPAAAIAANLSIAKSATVVSDQVNIANPKALPGSVVDYTVMVGNPTANALTPVRAQVIADTLPAEVALRVSDYGAGGSGPVDFTDGNLLGLGLTGSGLTYGFAGLASTTDGLEFYDGASWAYVPVPDANGYDARVRAIRITLTGTHAAGSAYRLRYRTRIR